MMLAKIVGLNFKKSLRTSDKFSVVVKIAIRLFLVLLSFSFGYFLETIYLKLDEDIALTTLISKGLFYFLSVDFILRYFLQKSSFPVVQLLALNIEKSVLAKKIIYSSFFSLFNFLPLAFATGLVYSSVFLLGNFLEGILWLLIFTLLIFNNHLIIFIVKKIFSKTFYQQIFLALYLALSLLLDASGTLEISNLFADLITFIFQNPYWLLVLFIWIFSLTKITFEKTKEALYLDDLQELATIKNSSNESNFIKIIEKEIGEFAALELKAIWRNERLKKLLIFNIVIYFAGISKFFEAKVLENDFLFLPLCLLLTLHFVFVFCKNYSMALEGNYFDLLMGIPQSFEKYFESKYWLYFCITNLSFILLLPLAFLDIKILIFAIIALIYNLGVNNFIIIYSSIYNDEKMDMSNASVFNSQGFNYFINIILIILCIGIPSAIYLFFYWLNLSFIGISLLVLFGISGIIFKKRLMNYILVHFNKEKHQLAVNFRK